jgi:hypothetical protein
MDEALERLIDTVVVRENVTRERAELIVWGLLEELRRLLDEHPARVITIILDEEEDASAR